MADSQFWYSVLLYTNRPNLINRRVIGTQFVHVWTVDGVEHTDAILEVIVPTHSSRTIDVLQKDLHLKELVDLQSIDLNYVLNSSSQFLVILRKLFLKLSLKKLQDASSPSEEFEFLVLNRNRNVISFIPIKFNQLEEYVLNRASSSCCFSISLKEDAFLQVDYLYGFEQSFWVENTLKVKLQQWLSNSSKRETSFQGSLQRISVQSYCSNYSRMKAKYSLPLLKIWTSVEKTDPAKFIFEDIAIAAYLVTLWQEEQIRLSLSKRQTFVDVGCGNGLLVYILAQEGYQGCGIDIRKRNIWSYFGESVNLIEKKIDLFSENAGDQLPSCDWLIGNHSDELTPWILFLASCASDDTRAFILPCCCYDFDGHKYQRVNEPNKSQYQCYIDYLNGLATSFGFNTFIDKLRIPSTKRICLVCHSRSYSTTLELDDGLKQRKIDVDLNSKRRQIVDARLKIRDSVRLREKTELVRNCTKIEQQIKDGIISKLVAQLLKQREGISLNEAIQLLDENMKNALRNQCGGLQTFVRNHRHIFTIVNHKIQFQSVEQLRHKEGRDRSKPCWFWHHHPDGCPLSHLECGYQH